MWFFMVCHVTLETIMTTCGELTTGALVRCPMLFFLVVQASLIRCRNKGTLVASVWLLGVYTHMAC